MGSFLPSSVKVNTSKGVYRIEGRHSRQASVPEGSIAMASKPVTRSRARRLSAVTTDICDLGPELLNLVFTKLAPSPLNLAAVPCVCKAWRTIMQEQIWQQLCLEVAPGLCKVLRYDAANEPPGGWAAMYKLLFFCPAHFRKSWYFDGWGSLAHVQTQSSGFQTGPEIASELRLKKKYRGDPLFVSRPCFHGDEVGNRHSTRTHACRGLVRNVAKSALAKRAGAREYLKAPPERQQRMRDLASDQCHYCQAPLYELESRVLAERDCNSSEDTDSDEDPEGFDFSGHMCGNRHIMLEILGNLGETPFLKAESLPDVREGLSVETSKIKRNLCSLMEPDPNAAVERRLWKTLDAFSLFTKLKCLERGYRETGMKAEICEDTDEDCKEPLVQGEITDSSAGRQVIVELGKKLTDVEKQIVSTIEGFERDTEEELDSNVEADIGAGPFWEVPLEAFQCIKDLLFFVPQCKRILTRFLAEDCKRSAETVLDGVRKLRRLDSRKSHISDTLRALREKRGDELEGKLRSAGIPPGSDKYHWPDSHSVCQYINVVS